VIVSDISNPFSANLARIIENEAEQHQYTTIFGSSDEDLVKFEKLVHTLVNRKVDGLILSPPVGAEEILLQLQQRDIPLVLLDRYFDAVKTSYVIIDNYAASFEAVNHLIDGGRKRIGMITYDTGLLHLQDRKNGYVAALENSRLGFDKARLKLVGIEANPLAIENALQELLAGKAPADAILFGSNKIALTCLRYINRLPLKVPQQLAVICFDYSEMLDLFYSPVTSIKQPLNAIGQQAVQCLLQNMNDTANTSAIQLKAELVVQQSTQPAVKRIEKQ
jgi:LacI family transcriptional regulator